MQDGRREGQRATSLGVLGGEQHVHSLPEASPGEQHPLTYHIKFKREVKAAPVAFTSGALGPQKQGNTFKIPSVSQPPEVLKMQDLKAPGKQPLPRFLSSSSPGDRPRLVPKPGMMGVPVTPGLTLLRGPVRVLSQDTARERLSPGLHPPPRLASAVTVYTCWFCLNVALCRPER